MLGGEESAYRLMYLCSLFLRVIGGVSQSSHKWLLLSQSRCVGGGSARAAFIRGRPHCRTG